MAHAGTKSLTLALAALILLLSGHLGPLRARWRESAEKTGLQARVRLSTTKRVYKIGERIVVSYSIENRGSEPFYVYPNLSLLDGGGAGFGVTIHDQAGKAVRRNIVGEGFPLLYKNVRIAEHIRNEWVLLHPRAFYGTSNTYHDRTPMKPGRYRITGVYWNRIPDWLTEEQRQSLRDLEHPILTGVHSAEAVWIEVRK